MKIIALAVLLAAAPAYAQHDHSAMSSEPVTEKPLNPELSRKGCYIHESHTSNDIGDAEALEVIVNWAAHAVDMELYRNRVDVVEAKEAKLALQTLRQVLFTVCGTYTHGSTERYYESIGAAYVAVGRLYQALRRPTYDYNSADAGTESTASGGAERARAAGEPSGGKD